MSPSNIAQTSQKIASFSLLLALTLFLLNAGCWFFPILITQATDAGLSFLLSERVVPYLANLAWFPWWQKLGGMLFSSVPLLAIMFGLYHLRVLFKIYAQGEFFSIAAAEHLGKVGRAASIWVVLDFLFTPIVVLWVTMLNPVGQRVLSVSVSSSMLMALFLSLCISVIEHILRQASQLAAENQQFV